jgi:hypothetical protein
LLNGINPARLPYNQPVLWDYNLFCQPFRLYAGLKGGTGEPAMVHCFQVHGNLSFFIIGKIIGKSY